MYFIHLQEERLCLSSVLLRYKDVYCFRILAINQSINFQYVLEYWLYLQIFHMEYS